MSEHEDMDLEIEIGELDVAAMRNRRKALLEELAALDDQLSQYETRVLDCSQVVKPVALCREFFLAMHPEGHPRKEVVRMCVQKGVAQNTAQTQYSLNIRKWERGWRGDIEAQ